MSEPLDVDSILSEAEEQEREYNWLGAVELYAKTLRLVSEQDFSRRGDICERLGYAFYRAAMQAESVDQFREDMAEAIANYENAREFYRMLGESGKTPRTLLCDAMIAYVQYWLAMDVPEKKSLLDECWQLTKEALDAFKEVGDALEYAEIYNRLSSGAYHRHVLELDFQAREKIIREAMEHGEQAITLLSSVGDSYELARALVNTAFYLTMYSWYFIPDMDEKEKHYSKARDYWQRANELSEKAALLELLSYSESLFWSVDQMLVHYEKALDYAKKTKDKFLIGTAQDRLAYANHWKSSGIEDPEKRVESYQKALQYAEDAKRQFSSISYVSSRGGVLWTGAPYAEYYWHLALWETEPRKRHDLLEGAIKHGNDTMELAESTGYHDIIGYAHHVLSRVLGSLAQLETSLEEKRRLLEKALEHRNESIKINEQLHFFNYYNRGVMWNYLADLKAELSNVEKDSQKIKNVVEEAISDKEHGVQLCIKDILYFEKIGDPSRFPVLGRYQYSQGELLNRLYKLTNNSEHQRKAIKAFEEATESFQKLNLVSRIAECYWKAARGYDDLGEHLKSAQNFNLASNNYTNAAQKIPQLKDFYIDHAVYMQAWSEIEKARHHHQKQEYGLAEEHFDKAANIHKSLKQWSYLAPNYSAWSKVEQAEELSRREQAEEALKAFEQASNLFIETRKSIQAQLGRIDCMDEKQMATSMIRATDLRHEYCVARIALEEAKILDKKGDHYSSSEKYGSATETFQKIAKALESEQEQKELKSIISLSRAWQKMTQAEAEASPALYVEASKLFEEAKDLSPNEKTKMLALGHSRFCRALEAGTKFVDTRDRNMYVAATKYLESAANYYVKASFQTASDYAKATELLFDGYVHIDDAKEEKNPEKKARLYAIAEKVLQTSAGSFMKAEHPEKREQVLGLLEKVKEELELAVSITEVLHAPSIISTTTSFATPTPTREEAVGSERFEHADIQANIITRQKELKVGENLDLEIELVNAGKGPALLIKVAEIIPQGFDLIEKPEKYRVEDSYLNMKGKRLDSLKTEELKFVLKPKAQGAFELKPKILYIDENGKYKSHEPEPINITVKELGIKGWLKGER